MRASKYLNSNYLKAADLEGKRRTVTVVDVSVEELPDSKDEALALHFEQTSKRFTLGAKINLNWFIENFSDDTDRWIGQQVALVPSKTEFRGKQVDCIRFDLPRADELDAAGADDIPF